MREYQNNEWEVQLKKPVSLYQKMREYQNQSNSLIIEISVSLYQKMREYQNGMFNVAGELKFPYTKRCESTKISEIIFW